ncbi:MAG: TatD family hydrolase [Defluviitaleaceae bacterium]|nr:TatD family hydrolase [Defluviitaleaceae bacterium]
MKYFDAHAHYIGKRYNKDRHRLLTHMHKNGVEYIVNSTSTLELEEGLQLAKEYDFVYLSIGDNAAYTSGPEGDKYISDEMLERMIKICQRNKKVVAWGEIGIDLRREAERSKEYPNGTQNQIYWFKKQLDAAKQVKLPVVIHSGDACQMVFDILKEADMPNYGRGRGMIHCYLGTPQMALEYIEMGYLISVTGVVTHKSARGRNLVEVVKKVPLENMLIETDCPYLTPEPIRNERNDSANLKFVAEKIAQIKNTTPEEVARATTANARAFFGIS